MQLSPWIDNINLIRIPTRNRQYPQRVPNPFDQDRIKNLQPAGAMTSRGLHIAR